MISKKFIHNIKNECKKDTTFIILCARKSNNRGYNNIPLTKLANSQYLIDEQIKTIRSVYKKSEIIIISGFEHDKLLAHIHNSKYQNIRIAENKSYKSCNTLDGWRFALNICIKQNICIIHGDRLFTKDCFADATSTYTIVHNIDKSNYNLGILYSENKFINMSYGLESVWSEIFFINSKDFNIARSIINNSKRIHNVETYINELSKEIDILVFAKEPKDVKALKDI